MSSNAAVSTGNRVAQFIVTTAVISALYQIITQPRQTSDSTLPNSPSPLDPGHGKGEDSRWFTSSEITGFLLFLGLYGLFQHKSNQEKKSDMKDELTQSNKKLQNQSLYTGTCKAEESGVTNLPPDVLNELLLYLSPKDLACCPLVSKSWDLNTGDAAEMLWRRVFQRDFQESGDRFAQVFPIASWRQFYFRHHLSRAVELARVLGLTQHRKCVVIEGQVYDVTDFLELHPGGAHVLGDTVGTDATGIWDQFRHSNEAKKSMQHFLVHDHVLQRPKCERLQGNLETVTARWRKTSWALTHSRWFGHMAPQIANALFCFHLHGASRKVSK